VTRTAFIARFPGETKIVMLGDSLIMRGDWSLLLPEFSIANHGVDGNTSTDILKRLDETLANPAPDILLMVGVNDLQAGRSVPEISANVETISARLTAAGRSVTVQSVPPNDLPPLQDKIPQLNDALRRLCAEQDCRFLDVAAIIPTTALADGLHLSADGYAAWADLLRKALRGSIHSG